MEYLGHIVSQHGVRTDPDKTSAVTNWPTPVKRKELRSFLGLCSYYRKFVRDFASIAAPLHALTKENQAFVWDEACDRAFEQLKRALTSTPVLRYPDPKKEFVLDTDASNHGIGAVLSQKEDGQERVVAFYSRALTAPEKKLLRHQEGAVGRRGRSPSLSSLLVWSLIHHSHGPLCTTVVDDAEKPGRAVGPLVRKARTVSFQDPAPIWGETSQCGQPQPKTM